MWRTHGQTLEKYGFDGCSVIFKVISSAIPFSVNFLFISSKNPQIVKILNLYTPSNEFEGKVSIPFIRKVQERLKARDSAVLQSSAVGGEIDQQKADLQNVSSIAKLRS